MLLRQYGSDVYIVRVRQYGSDMCNMPVVCSVWQWYMQYPRPVSLLPLCDTLIKVFYFRYVIYTGVEDASFVTIVSVYTSQEQVAMRIPPMCPLSPLCTTHTCMTMACLSLLCAVVLWLIIHCVMLLTPYASVLRLTSFTVSCGSHH